MAISSPSSLSKKDPSASHIAGVPAGTVMTPEYVATVARFAYIWGWPLVNNLNRSLAMKDLPGPGRIGGIVPASPPGHISMLSDYISLYIRAHWPREEITSGGWIPPLVKVASNSRAIENFRSGRKDFCNP